MASHLPCGIAVPSSQRRWQEHCAGVGNSCQGRGIRRWEQLGLRSGPSLSPSHQICRSELFCNYSGAGRSLKIFAKKWWQKKEESQLKKDSALPLPLAYSTPKPLSKEEFDKVLRCDPEKQDCKPPVYQWTGKCKSCQGTGLVSFRRKRGHEVISKCIPCLGLGYVQKVTSRQDIQVMEELDPE